MEVTKQLAYAYIVCVFPAKYWCYWYVVVLTLERRQYNTEDTLYLYWQTIYASSLDGTINLWISRWQFGSTTQFIIFSMSLMPFVLFYRKSHIWITEPLEPFDSEQLTKPLPKKSKFELLECWTNILEFFRNLIEKP